MENNERTLEEIIQEIAEEEGMTYEETMKLFQKGLRDSLGKPKKNKEQVKKDKKKRKQAKASRKKNRK